jgi:hypothetical protein
VGRSDLDFTMTDRPNLNRHFVLLLGLAKQTPHKVPSLVYYKHEPHRWGTRTILNRFFRIEHATYRKHPEKHP